MTADQWKARKAIARLEAELARLREVADWYEDREEPIPAEAEMAIEDIERQIAEMVREPTRQ